MSDKYNHFLEFKKNIEFSKAFMNLEDVHGQNKHSSKNQMKSLGRQLCEYYCIGLHKRLNSLKHHVHYLTE